MTTKVTRKELRVGERADGSPVILPLVQYKGTAGPTVFIGCGIHGDELTGQASLWKLYEHLKGKDIRGTITIMPVMNPDGLSFNVRGIPEAGVDLNRLYPGRAAGHISERITAKIWEIAKKHECIIDLHTMGGNSVPMVLIDIVAGELKKRMDRIADATGITVLEELPSEEYALQNLGSSLGGVATAANIPNITIELGGVKSIDRGSVDAGYLAVRNVLVELGVCKGVPTRIKSSVAVPAKGYRRDEVWSGKGGVVEYVVSVGDKVSKGGTLAKIRNVYGEVVEEVKMPEDGYMIAESLCNASPSGGYIACIAVKMKK